MIQAMFNESLNHNVNNLPLIILGRTQFSARKLKVDTLSLNKMKNKKKKVIQLTL